MTPLLYHYLAVGAILFVLGMIGFLSRRNLIVLFLSGLLDTTLLLAVLIWPALMILRILRYPPLPLKPGN